MRSRRSTRAMALCITIAIALTIALGSAPAMACGYCVEDRIAAVYDHALLQRTLANRHQIAFFAWEGPVTRGAAARLKVLALGEATPGVDKGSVRVSMEPAAVAVAFDPNSINGKNIQKALQKTLGSMKLSIIFLQSK